MRPFFVLNKQANPLAIISVIMTWITWNINIIIHSWMLKRFTLGDESASDIRSMRQVDSSYICLRAHQLPTHHFNLLWDFSTRWEINFPVWWLHAHVYILLSISNLCRFLCCHFFTSVIQQLFPVFYILIELWMLAWTPRATLGMKVLKEWTIA